MPVSYVATRQYTDQVGGSAGFWQDFMIRSGQCPIRVVSDQGSVRSGQYVRPGQYPIVNGKTKYYNYDNRAENSFQATPNSGILRLSERKRLNYDGASEFNILNYDGRQNTLHKTSADGIYAYM